MRELTFHPLVGLFSKLEPPLVPILHDAGLLRLLSVGFPELLILLTESVDVSYQPPLGDLRALLGLRGSSDLRLELFPQLLQLSLYARRLAP